MSNRMDGDWGKGCAVVGINDTIHVDVNTSFVERYKERNNMLTMDMDSTRVTKHKHTVVAIHLFTVAVAVHRDGTGRVLRWMGSFK